MRRSIDALNQLLVSLLDISKLDADIVKPELTHFDLRNLLDILHSEYAPQAEAKRLTFQMQVEGEFIVYSDQTLLETMLRNLISNAIRYTQQGGVSVVLEQMGTEVRTTRVSALLAINTKIFFASFIRLRTPNATDQKGWV